MFIAVLFTIARMWKQPRCPSTDEWIKSLWYIYTMEYCCWWCLIAKSYLTLFWPYALLPARVLCLWDLPGKNTAVGCHFLIQGLFQTQGLNPHLLHWQVDTLPLSLLGSPMEYYLAIERNEFESVELRWMNLEPVIQSKISQKEKSKYCIINTNMGNLEKWYWWTYLEGRNRDADIENRLVDTAGEREGGRNWESSTEICTLPYITSGKLLYNAGSSNQCSVTT